MKKNSVFLACFLSVITLFIISCDEDDKDDVNSLDDCANSTWVGYISEWDDNNSTSSFVISGDTLRFGNVIYDENVMVNVISTGEIKFGRLNPYYQDREVKSFLFWYDSDKVYERYYHLDATLIGSEEGYSERFKPEGKDKLLITNGYFVKIK